MIEFEDIERVAIVLETKPVRDGVHRWTRTLDLPWLVTWVCRGCGCFASVTGKGLAFSERAPSGMVHRASEPRACLRFIADNKTSGGPPIPPTADGSTTSSPGDAPEEVPGNLLLPGVGDAA